MNYFKYKGSKIALGVFLIILAFVNGIPQMPTTSEQWGAFVFDAILMIGGSILITRGFRNRKKDLAQF